MVAWRQPSVLPVLSGRAFADHRLREACVCVCVRAGARAGGRLGRLGCAFDHGSGGPGAPARLGQLCASGGGGAAEAVGGAAGAGPWVEG